MEAREIWFTTKQVAHVLDFSVNHISKMCHRGDFPNAKKDGRCWMVSLQDIDAFHQRQREKASAPVVQAKPTNRITRDDVKLAAFRAYYRADRCPPGCPGRDECLFGTCIMPDLLKGASHD